ncbi:MAG: D-hexose-6-phosphate mutarotase [Pseudomonadota bacterium]|nr:D-hexose-6-phosphate mutarotase [Hydrogenophaga sp.]MDP1904533.1 D-hexose-6-phosphate mutarotase [Pseudomonadota bacterium]MDP2351627.1 D-hexose-6-phosphate mutarotase [Pseudomonadota bacterium]
MPLAALNNRFGLADQLKFVEGPGGLLFAEIDNALGTAYLCLQGAHITTFRPKDQDEPVIWLSDYAKFAPGKSIRGGAPVCWPWFGAHDTEAGFPGHGFARTVMWDVTQSGALASGETEITLTLVETEQTRTQWPHKSRVELKVVVGRSLKAELITTNLGDADITIGEALHTYLQIGDIAEIKVLGLEGCEYVDKVGAVTRRTQDGAVTFDGEVDRVYVNTEATCVIEDSRLKRRVIIAKRGSRSTVVWTPWTEKADKMGDFGPDGWRKMVCVESVNALENVVVIPAGQSHTMSVEYSAEAL